MPTINYAWNGVGNGGGDWLPYLAAIYGLAWLFTLGLSLTRLDLDPVSRLTWVLVIIFVPVAGMLLYFVLAPPRAFQSQSTRLDRGGDTSGTPWEENPGHTQPSDT